MAGLTFIGWKALVFLFPSDEMRIRKKLGRLESLVSYTPNTPPLVHLASAGGILEMFTQNAGLNIKTDSSTWNIHGRNEIKTYVLSSRQQERAGMQVRITDPVFEFGKGGSISTLATVTARWESNPDIMVRIMEFKWVKGERNQWLISSIKTREDLEWGNKM
ncbi:hypothetical protein N8683_00035 [bacterium]|nr:hypothetical protein [bacterium]MDA7662285.1 hypothetical protein [Verrucomicrobiota bacterium]MDB4619318.1 hypothetical protein [bacterium]